MITINQLTDNRQLEITYPGGDPNPIGDLVGRTWWATLREVIDDCRGMARYYLYLAKGASL